MRMIKYIVHSDIDENNIYWEFENKQDAIAYAKENKAEETWVDAVEVEVNDVNEVVEEYSKETIWSYVDECLEKPVIEEACLSEAIPEGDRVISYNNGLKLAKVYNKPVIYGYTNNRLGGKFFALEDPIICNDIAKCEADFRNQYKNCNVVYAVYPDKEFIEGYEPKDDFETYDFMIDEKKPVDEDLLIVDPFSLDCWEVEFEPRADYDISVIADQETCGKDTCEVCPDCGCTPCVCQTAEVEPTVEEEPIIAEVPEIIAEVNADKPVEGEVDNTEIITPEDRDIEDKSFQELVDDPNNPDVTIESDGSIGISGDTMLKAFEQGINVETGEVAEPGELDNAEPIKAEEEPVKTEVVVKAEIPEEVADKIDNNEATIEIPDVEIKAEGEVVDVQKDEEVKEETKEEDKEEEEVDESLNKAEANKETEKHHCSENDSEELTINEAITDDPEAVAVVSDLIKDEVEAIDGYKDAKEVITDPEVKDTIEHIEGEEVEHIDELADTISEVPEEISEPEVEETENVEEPITDEVVSEENIEDTAIENPVEEIVTDESVNKAEANSTAEKHQCSENDSEELTLHEEDARAALEKFASSLDEDILVDVQLKDEPEVDIEETKDKVEEIIADTEELPDESESHVIVREVDELQDPTEEEDDMSDEELAEKLYAAKAAKNEGIEQNCNRIETEQELHGIDNAVVDCPVNPVIAHSEDEKPLDCEMEKKPLDKPLTEDAEDFWVNLKTEVEKSGEAYYGEAEPDEYPFLDDSCVSYSVDVFYNKDEEYPYGVGFYFCGEDGPVGEDPEPEVFFKTFEDMKAYLTNGYKCPEGIDCLESLKKSLDEGSDTAASDVDATMDELDGAADKAEHELDIEFPDYKDSSTYRLIDVGFNYDSIKPEENGAKDDLDINYALLGDGDIYGYENGADTVDNISFRYYPNKHTVEITHIGREFDAADKAQAEEILLDNLEVNLTAGWNKEAEN